MNKILIVDDSKDLLEAMELILQQQGYEVRTLAGGFHVLEAIGTFHPDLIILDIFLAGSDGREICKEIKKNILYSNVCILVFSASPKALEDYKLYGADGYLEKPFGINILLDKIEQVLQDCRQIQATGIL